MNTARRGQAALGMTLLVGGFCVAVAVGLAFLVLSFLNSSFGYQAAERAFVTASGGTSDALLRLTRNKDLAGLYSVPVGDYTASVTITQDAPAVGEATIVSQAIVAGYKRKMKTIIDIDGQTGELTTRSSNLTL